ncbi:MAG: CHAD domain-containing protein [Vicinamibacterales bacterium]
MSYCFKPHHPLARDARAIIARQLARAERELVTVGDARSDRAVHDARRHLKKILALLRLLKPVLGRDFERASRPVRRASAMLAPVADAEALVGATGVLGVRQRQPAIAQARQTIQEALRAHEADTGRRANFQRLLPRVLRLLAVERPRLDAWSLDVDGFDAIAPGLERSVRRTQQAMVRAARHPRAGAFHAWRRRVKDLWFQVRLVERRCGFGLDASRRALEALDGLLGRYHNMVLLERVLVRHPCLSRNDTADCLRTIHRRRRALGRRALSLGVAVLHDSPETFVARVRHLWRTAPAAASRASSVSCPSA